MIIKKKFYTFAEISNIINILNRITPDTEYGKNFVNEKKEMNRELVVDMQDAETTFAFIRYHLHGEGDGKRRLYISNKDNKDNIFNPFFVDLCLNK